MIENILIIIQAPFATPIIVGITTEAIKILGETVRGHAWKPGLFRPGGIPSSHAAFVTSLLVVVGHADGVASTTFALASVIALLTWYDAAGSRHTLGEHAKILNRLHPTGMLPERQGHSIVEVCAGIVVGGALTGMLLQF